MIKKFLFSIVAPLASMVSMLAMPMQAAAQPCCPSPCDPCEDECCDNGWMEKLGLILVAAGAGALAGWGAAEATKGRHHHHGHDHDCFCPTGAIGPTGPTGPSSFTTTTDTLTFSMGGLINIALATTGTVVDAFVSTPDGRVFATPAFTFSGILGPITIPPVTIIVPNATLGTYTYGFVFPSGVTMVLTTFTGSVVSSRDPLASTELLFANAPPPIGPQSAEFQIQGDFTYGSASQFP